MRYCRERGYVACKRLVQAACTLQNKPAEKHSCSEGMFLGSVLGTLCWRELVIPCEGVAKSYDSERVQQTLQNLVFTRFCNADVTRLTRFCRADERPVGAANLRNS